MGGVGGPALIEDDLSWKTTSLGRRALLEDDLCSLDDSHFCEEASGTCDRCRRDTWQVARGNMRHVAEWDTQPRGESAPPPASQKSTSRSLSHGILSKYFLVVNVGQPRFGLNNP